MKVVVLLLSDRPPAAGTEQALSKLGDDLVVVTWRPLPFPVGQVVLGRAATGLTLVQKLTRKARIDPQRHRAWWALRRSEEAQQAVAAAGLLVAADPTSVLSGWRLAQRYPDVLAVSSLGAAAVRLEA